jgi:hypothetical protein
VRNGTLLLLVFVFLVGWGGFENFIGETICLFLYASKEGQ